MVLEEVLTRTRYNGSMKPCTRCNEEKALTEFGKSKGKPDGLNYWCKSCMSEYKARYYQTNKVKLNKLSDERRREYRDKISKLKEAPCTDCKLQYNPWQMQFDHVSGDKVNDISKLVANRQYGKLDAELAKCELVCANCHADRTYKRQSLTAMRR